MNKLQEAINKLKEEANQSEEHEELLAMLQKKEQELGSEPSEEEVDQAIKQVISEHLAYVLKNRLSRETGPDEDDAWDENMDDNMEIIHSVFREMDLHYRDYIHQKGVRAFELGVSNKGKSLRMKVYLESVARVCRVDAIFPFQADRAFEYPLCDKMASENYPRRFGALQRDPKDGELSYRYSFPILRGLDEETFRTVFMAVIASAFASYDVIKQYAVGRFRKPTRDDIICRAQELIIELDQ